MRRRCRDWPRSPPRIAEARALRRSRREVLDEDVGAAGQLEGDAARPSGWASPPLMPRLLRIDRGRARAHPPARGARKSSPRPGRSSLITSAPRSPTEAWRCRGRRSHASSRGRERPSSMAGRSVHGGVTVVAAASRQSQARGSPQAHVARSFCDIVAPATTRRTYGANPASRREVLRFGALYRRWEACSPPASRWRRPSSPEAQEPGRRDVTLSVGGVAIPAYERGREPGAGRYRWSSPSLDSPGTSGHHRDVVRRLALAGYYASRRSSTIGKAGCRGRTSPRWARSRAR